MKFIRDGIGNGNLTLPVGKKYVRVWGGPSRGVPADKKFLKMAAEISMSCDLDVPTRDFDTPASSLIDRTLPVAVRSIISGEPWYVGCMGGQGRTGLMLALIAKAFGVEKPVEYVRHFYFPHAVETDEQYKFVNGYKVPEEIGYYLEIADALTWLVKGNQITVTGKERFRQRLYRKTFLLFTK